jgi:glucose-6-phosphate 1-dehydrogenase
LSIVAALPENELMTTWQSFDLVLFGGTGDLAMRKLLPALYRRFVAGLFPEDARIVGVARSALTRDAYLAQMETGCREHAGDTCSMQAPMATSRKASGS